MKLSFFSNLLLLSVSLGLIAAGNNTPGDHKTLAIGSPAPDFSLKGIDGKMNSLSTFKSAKILVVVFTCDHCPTAQAYEDRLIQLTKDYTDRDVAVVAIMPNDPKSVQLNELGYTDLGDTYEKMKIRAQKNISISPIYTMEIMKRLPMHMAR